MNRIVICLLAISLFTTKLLFSQQITAGDTNSVEFYSGFHYSFDMHGYISSGSHFYEQSKDLDIDGNGIGDFHFNAYSGGGLGGGSAHFLIKPLHDDYYIAFKNDTTITPWDTSIAHVPLDFRLGQMIISDLDYTNKVCYLFRSVYGMESGPIVLHLNNIGSFFIGFKVEGPEKKIGWIKASITREEYSYDLYVESFAYNFFSTTSIPIIENKISVYPNPAKDYFTIESGSSFKNSKAQLFCLNGQLILEENIPGLMNSQINISTIPAGLYILKISNNSDQYSRLIAIE